MAVAALVSWLKNPFEGNHSEIAVNKLKRIDYILILLMILRQSN